MNTIKHPYAHRRWIGQDEAKEWLSQFGELALLVTITLKDNIPGGLDKIRERAENALKIYLSIINRRLFKNRFKRGEAGLACVAVFHGRFNPLNPHLHLAIEVPKGEEEIELIQALKKQIRRMDDFGYISEVKPFSTSGAVDYIIKEGQDSILLDRCSKGV